MNASTPRMLVLTAVAMEARAVADALEMACPKPGKPTRKMLNEMEVEVHWVGIGASRLPELGQNANVQCVIMAGLGGALDAELEVGSIVIDGLAEGRPV